MKTISKKVNRICTPALVMVIISLFFSLGIPIQIIAYIAGLTALIISALNKTSRGATIITILSVVSIAAALFHSIINLNLYDADVFTNFFLNPKLF